ncbi:helix-turn-helix domain-containing protein [Clostridium butyricum]|uniref:Helix-turn-helix domain protein n=1 Tax=Clostridium butyricum TaxID=1492 RepID=A0A6N3FL86_CLOBU
MFKKEKIIDELNKKGWSRYKLCKEAGMAQSTLSDILGGKNVSPKTSTLQRIADALDVSINVFFDDKILPSVDVNSAFAGSGELKMDNELSQRAERDIQKSLSQTLDMIENSQDGLMFDGEPLELDDLTKELLKQSLENSMRMAKKIAKEKYTPKKYKK